MISRFTMRITDVPIVMDLDLICTDDPVEGSGYKIETMEKGRSHVLIKTCERIMKMIRQDKRFEWVEDLDQ